MAYQLYRTNEQKPRPRNDAYTGLLAISFAAMVAACALLVIEWCNYPRAQPEKVQLPPLKLARISG